MASNPKMEYQVFLCISQKNSALPTYLMFEGNILKAGVPEELAADEMVRKVYLGQNSPISTLVLQPSSKGLRQFPRQKFCNESHS